MIRDSDPMRLSSFVVMPRWMLVPCTGQAIAARLAYHKEAMLQAEAVEVHDSVKEVPG